MLAQILFANEQAEKTDALVEEVLAIDASNGQALLMKAGRLVQAGAYEEAVADLRTVLQDEPNSSRGLGLLSEAHLRAGDNELAIESLRSLVTVMPGNTEARLQLARLLAERGENVAALDQLNEVLERDPNSVSALQRKIELLAAERDWTQAEQAARDLVGASEGEQEALGYQALGRVFQFSQRYDEAIDAYQEVLERAPDAPEPLTALAQTLVHKGQSDEAIQFLNDYIEKSPENPVAHNLLGEVHAAQQEFDVAKISFERAKELAQQWRTPYLNLGRIHLASGESGQAIAVYREGLRRIEGDRQLQLALALVYQQEEDYAAAREVYETLLKTHPEMDAAANNLAIIIATFAHENRLELESALQLVEGFRDSENPYFLDTLGWVHYRLGNATEAILYLEQAISSGLDIPELHYHMGMAYHAANQPDKAREHLDKAVIEGASYPGVQEARRILASF